MAENVPHPTLTLTTSILASSLAFIDSSVINVALPALRADLGGTAADIQWTINGYALPLTALLLIFGAAGDRFGRRRLLVIGMTVFALASIGCAAAQAYTLLVTLRVLQGVGAALLMPNSLALLSAAFPEKIRGRAIATWAAAAVVASAVGPPLGGWLIALFGWRSIFIINVPVAALGVAFACRYVSECPARNVPMDWLGAGLATLTLGLFAWTLTLWSGRQTEPSTTLALLVVAFVTATVFLVLEYRRGERAMIPLAIFASSAFIGLAAVTFFLYAALSGLFLLLPYLLIEGGYTPLQTGLALLPFPAIVAGASRSIGRLVEHYGVRWPLALGSTGAAAGYLLMTRIEPSGSYFRTVVPGAAVIAIGMAGAVTPLQTAVLGAVDARHTGTASGLTSTISRSGGLIATALLGGVLAQQGGMLVKSFHAVCLVGAALALAAALIAALVLDKPHRLQQSGGSNPSTGTRL